MIKSILFYVFFFLGAVVYSYVMRTWFLLFVCFRIDSECMKTSRDWAIRMSFPVGVDSFQFFISDRLTGDIA